MNLYHLLFSLLTLLPLPTTNTATHYVAGKAVSKTQKALQTRLKATAHRKDYVAKLAKSKKIPKIGPAGDPSARFRNATPKNWQIKAGRNKKSTKYVNPRNNHDYIRFSSENRHPKARTGQKIPYFERYLNGKVLTCDGKWVNPKTYPNKADFHIPQDLYDKYAHLLKFNKNDGQKNLD